jgi:hypothetical protein
MKRASQVAKKSSDRTDFRIAGSAGPLGAAAFLGLRLSPRAYVASEAVAAV